MRHEPILAVHRPDRHAETTTSVLQQPGRTAAPGADTPPPPASPPPVRRGSPACAWQCTHCSVRCAVATIILRDLQRERSTILETTSDRLSSEQVAKLAQLDWQLEAGRKARDEARSEALSAELAEAKERFAAKRAARQSRKNRLRSGPAVPPFLVRRDGRQPTPIR